MESKVKAIKFSGIRMNVPTSVLRELKFELGDIAEWNIEEREGRKVAVLVKKEKTKSKNGEKK